MPAKNAIKTYVDNAYYHIYNRGVEKRNVFMEDQDYIVFLHFLKRYLIPPPESPNEAKPPWRSDLHDRIRLVAYCLMPNHFHLMIKQQEKETIAHFMQSLITSYVYYFNKRYQRTGALFEGRYKAVLIDAEPQLLHLTRYIHLNPIELLPAGFDLAEYKYSSYKDFLGRNHTIWVHPEEILQFFKTAQKTSLEDILSYQSFIEDYKEDSRQILKKVTLE